MPSVAEEEIVGGGGDGSLFLGTRILWTTEAKAIKNIRVLVYFRITMQDQTRSAHLCTRRDDSAI
jgi:hypothetical protein